MNFRTDLALELREQMQERLPAGVEYDEEEQGELRISRIQVTTQEGSDAFGKPIGRYVTVELPPFRDAAQLLDGRLNAITQELRAMLPENGVVLVVGLGNNDITPDALGPKAADLVLATRHIQQEHAKSMGLEGLRAVANLAPGVLGQTGMETGEIIAGVVATIRPAAVIIVDALAARKLSRMGCTVQLTDSGIVPGAGVGNARKAINRETLGVPVISMGVPTVVDAATLTMDILASRDAQFAEDESLRSFLGEDAQSMVVTPREIDLVIERAARLIAMAINCALQPQIDAEDLLTLVS